MLDINFFSIGAKMAAEYQPQTGKYYYYTSDQIGSTRIVTDDAGHIVYAAAHDPYGGVQQTWVNVFNPELKFSGKEQDTESGLYYFGARYYDPTLYRFLSPDPVIQPAELPTTPSAGICMPIAWGTRLITSIFPEDKLVD